MTVVWHSLTLEGFGRYQKSVRVEFKDGINTIVAANESGKSTLVSGLAAVIFGLYGSSSRDSFSVTRFMNWDGPARFRGLLEFSVDESRYRIERIFDTNQVQMDMIGRSGEWENIVAGEHNPGAHKRNEKYEDTIAGLIGVRSRDLFERTFLIMQPLPEMKDLDSNVQQLLSGADGGVEDALSHLFNKLRDLTRYNADLGVGTANAKNDRELDLIERRIADAEKFIKEQAQVLDELPVRQAELLEAEEKRRSISAELRVKRATDAAWSEWRAARNAYEALLKQKDSLSTALTRIAEISRQVDDARRHVDRDYANFGALSPDTGDKLSELAKLDSSTAERDKQIKSLEERMKRLKTDIASMEARLSAEFSDVSGRPELAANLAELQSNERRLAEIESGYQEASQAVARAEERLGDIRDLSRLGSSPKLVLTRARAEADVLKASWRRFTDARAKVKELRALLFTTFGVFQRLSPQAILMVSHYDVLEERLQRDAQATNHEMSRADQAQRQFASLRDAYRREFEDIDRVDSGFAEAAQSKISLLEERYKIAAVLQSASFGMAPAPRVTPLRVLLTLLVAACCFSGIWFMWGQNAQTQQLGIGISIGGALFGALIGWILGAPPQHARQQDATDEQLERLDAIEQQVSDLDGVLGAFASKDQAGLAEVLSRLSRRDVARENLERVRHEIPTDDTIRELKSREAAATGALASFHETMKLVREAYDNPGEAYRTWKEISDSLPAHEAQLADAIKSLGIQVDPLEKRLLDPDGVDILPLLPRDSFDALMAAAAVAGQRIPSIKAAAMWLSTTDQKWWDEMLAEAQDFEAWSLKLERARERLMEYEPQKQSLLRQVAALKEAIGPLDYTLDPVKVRQQIEQATTLERQKDRFTVELGDAERQITALVADQRKQMERADSLRQAVSAALSVAGSGVVEALARWRSYQEVTQAMAGLVREQRGMLQGQGLESEDALRSRVSDYEVRVNRALDSWENLCESKPGLPPADLQYDQETLMRRQAQLVQEIEQMEKQSVQVEEQIHRLNRQVAVLEGGQSRNVAQLQEQLSRDRLAVSDLRRRTVSVATAHKELQDAKRAFQSTYRSLLARRTTERFQGLSNVKGRRVLFDQDFKVSLEIDAKPCSLLQLSQGARDQLYIAIRLSIADLLAFDVNLPFIFDDPFLTFDGPRTERIKDTLHDISTTRQVLVLSHRGEVAAWGTPARIKE